MCKVTQFIKDHRFEIDNGLVIISPTLDKIVRDGMKAIDNAVVKVIERHEKAIEGELIPANEISGPERERILADAIAAQRQQADAQYYGLQQQGLQNQLSGIGQAQGAFAQAAYNPFGGF